MADVVCAAATLDLSGADLVALTTMLGFRAWSPAVPMQSHATDAGAPPPVAETAVDGHSPAAAAPATSPSVHGGRRRTLVTELAAEEPVGLEPLVDPPVAWSPRGSDEAPYVPPVPDVTLRAALTMLLRRPRLGRRPDVTALAHAAAAMRPPRELPWEREHSLDRGVAVVADVGPAMLPYLADVVHLAEQVELVVGTAGTTTSWPRGRAVDDLEVADLTPTGDRPVLIIGLLDDLLASSASVDGPGWQDLPRRLAADGADVVALVPHRDVARRQWPHVHVVAWDDLPAAGRGRA